ncbi:hypothetical protein PVAP13_2KG423200 [Panicum virgatum]|uniref:Uncharacterized protein n=1 Tax=Panicum virgatum TaxID=38727 RepID=A0A8T0WKR1_PANVG|nr:hypothetical protein PVAP13_2KG423200 [Panicum virgatum]
MTALDVYCVPLNPVVEWMPETTGWQGGWSFDFDGNFVGMNLDLGMRLPIILPRSGIALLNAHRDPFGDVYPDGVWGNFDKSFSLLLSKSVVALASFNATLVRDPDGSNKIVEGLKIKVLLPNNQSKEGKLKHCSLQYNVALISVKNCCYVHHVNLEQCAVNFSSTVVAVGRSFESGVLMATSGEGTCWSGPFDCEDLCPLVGIDGTFVGMNYYDKKMGTPFLFFFDVVGSMDERELEEEHKVVASRRRTSSRRIQYAYTDGDVTVLK